MKGLFTFEGGEGAGKTTVINLVSDMLDKNNINYISTREPGGVASAEAIREVILNEDINGVTECLLFAAARRQHLIEKVIPGIKNNNIVLMDRYLDSSLVYQGIARELNAEGVFLINKLAINNSEVKLSQDSINLYANDLANLLTDNSDRFEHSVIGDKILSIINNFSLDSITILLLKSAVYFVNSKNNNINNLSDKLSSINDLVEKIIPNSKLFIPTITFILDIQPEVGIKRIMSNSEREVNRLDKESIDFHYKIRNGYLNVSQNLNKDRNYKILNADNSPDYLANEIFNMIINQNG